MIGKEVHDCLHKGNIDPKQTLTGYGRNLMGAYAGRWLRAYRPLQENVTYYQFGAMGPDNSMMTGCSAAVKDGKGAQAPYKGAPTLVVTGDAGMGFSLMELDTASRYRVPVISVVYNNDWARLRIGVTEAPARRHTLWLSGGVIGNIFLRSMTMRLPPYRLLSALGLGSTLLICSAAFTQATPRPSGPTITILADEPVSGNDKMHAVVGIANWQPGGATMRHYHAGDEYATVLEGAVEIDNEGQAPRIYKAGQAYHNKRGVVHVARNANNGPSKLSFVLIIDKGSPLQVPAK